jgi:hypothetical protein
MTSANSVHFSSRGQDWLTPPLIIVRASAVLSAIDLDPCANREAPNNVPARRCLTEADDAIGQPWSGRIYMNPPYGRATGKWSGSSEKNIGPGMRRRQSHFFRLARTPLGGSYWRYPECFIRGRLQFSGHENGAPFPSAVVYLGPDILAFSAAFGHIGVISCRVPELS